MMDVLIYADLCTLIYAFPSIYIYVNGLIKAGFQHCQRLTSRVIYDESLRSQF